MIIPTLLILAAYLLGSIPFGYLLVRWAKGIDVQTQGSGNIGMTNVWRVAGAGWGIATLFLDIAKGALAVFLARHFGQTDSIEVLGGSAALLGNIFSVFLNFTGGKGIGVSTGIFFSLLPLESSYGLLLFLLGFGATRMISVGSLLGVTTMALLTLWHKGFNWFSGFALLSALLVWWTHRQNIQRIFQGTEKRVGRKPQKTGERT